MTSLTLYDQVVEAAAAIQTRTSLKPAVALILGSGLGDLATDLKTDPDLEAIRRHAGYIALLKKLK